MKKIIIAISAIALACCSCTKEETADLPVAVESVTIDKASLELKEGATFQLAATVLPEDAADTRVAWMSTDESVATVSRTGLVKAVAPGSASIRAISLDGGKVAVCAINVTGEAKPDQDAGAGAGIEDFN